MNNFLKNIAARSLNQMDVIQPRLAGRFEAAPSLNLPRERARDYLQKDYLPGDMGHSRGDGWQTRDVERLNHHPDDPQVTASGENISRSILTVRTMEKEGQQHQFVSELMETRKPSIASGLEEDSMRHDIRADSIIPIPRKETTSSRSPIYASSLSSISQETLKPPEKIQDPGREAKPEGQSTKKEAPPIASIKKGASYNEPVDVKVLASKGSDILPPEEKAPRTQEEERIPLMPEPPKSLKKAGVLASRIIRREIEIIPLKSIEVDETEKGMEGRIDWDSSEPVASFEPSMPPASPVLTMARPRVKSYFESKMKEMPERAVMQEEAAPVLVTIGRIEVKATNESAKPQRVRASPPVMSLDDYLEIKRGSL